MWTPIGLHSLNNVSFLNQNISVKAQLVGLGIASMGVIALNLIHSKSRPKRIIGKVLEVASGAVFGGAMLFLTLALLAILCVAFTQIF